MYSIFENCRVAPFLILAALLAGCNGEDGSSSGAGSASGSGSGSASGSGSGSGSSSSSGGSVTVEKSLVLIGGGLDAGNKAVFQRIVDLAGGAGKAKIGVITASAYPYDWDDPATRDDPNSDNSKQNAQYYADIFKGSFGVSDAQWIPVDVANVAKNDDEDLKALVDQMTGFFFSGGDQSRIMAALVVEKGGAPADSPVLAAIRLRFDEGAVVAGTSAGAAVQTSRPMLANGESYYAFINPPAVKTGAAYYKTYTDQSFDQESNDDLWYDPNGGLGFFTYGLLDTHFSERGRQGRLVRLAAATSTDSAYAVDENTALVVTGAGTEKARMEVLGEGGVSVFDLSAAAVSAAGDVTGVMASYLREGDELLPDTREVLLGAGKAEASGSLAAPSTKDIFSSADNIGDSGGRRLPRKFADVTSDFFRSAAPVAIEESCEDGPIVRVTLGKGAQSKAVVSSSGGVSYTGLSIAMAAVDEEHDFGEAGCSGRYGHSAAAHNGRLYVIGGYDRAESSDVWSSTDGKTWSRETASAGFSPRYSHSSVVSAGKLWVLGGNDGADRADVWSSADGKAWQMASAKASWGARSSHTTLAFKSDLWVLGGADTAGDLRDAWSSADGIAWSSATVTAPFYRSDHSSVVFPCPTGGVPSGDCMWVIGGYDGSSAQKYFNDVWYSADGVDWYEATANADWDPRSAHASVVFQCPAGSGLLGDCMWLIGGVDDLGEFRSVWYSKDGAAWSLAIAKPTWLPRRDFATAVFACPAGSGIAGDCMWLIGGRRGELRYQDAWYSGDGATWKRSALE